MPPSIGTQGDDTIDSKDLDDSTVGLTGEDKIKSGEGDDINVGDTGGGDLGSGNDKINAGQENDRLFGNGGADKFHCSSGEDTVLDFDPAEGDKATGNCKNV